MQEPTWPHPALVVQDRGRGLGQRNARGALQAPGGTLQPQGCGPHHAALNNAGLPMIGRHRVPKGTALPPSGAQHPVHGGTTPTTTTTTTTTTIAPKGVPRAVPERHVLGALG